MFTFNASSGPTGPLISNRHSYLYSAALETYQRAKLRGGLTKVWAALRGRSAALKNLEQIVADRRVMGRHYVGLRLVPISQIRGSENRALDFDDHFNPTCSHNRHRWVSVMLARMMDVPLPPVELIQIGEDYYVRDGHHRISVAGVFGQTEIDAEVTIWEVADVEVPRCAAAPAVMEIGRNWPCPKQSQLPNLR